MRVVVQQGKASDIPEHLVNCLSSTKRVARVPPGRLVWVEVDLSTVRQDDRSVDATELRIEVGSLQVVRVRFRDSIPCTDLRWIGLSC